jgi:hypothetical protein
MWGRGYKAGEFVRCLFPSNNTFKCRMSAPERSFTDKRNDNPVKDGKMNEIENGYSIFNNNNCVVSLLHTKVKMK